MMPRYFFFGLIEVPMWDYYWGLTAAQVELLTIDQPILVYKAEKNKEKPWKDGQVSSDYAKRAYQKWLEGKKKRDREGTTFNMQKVYEQGKKVDLKRYLQNGEKVEID